MTFVGKGIVISKNENAIVFKVAIGVEHGDLIIASVVNKLTRTTTFCMSRIIDGSLWL
jgi:hypothetical protein